MPFSRCLLSYLLRLLQAEATQSLLSRWSTNKSIAIMTYFFRYKVGVTWLTLLVKNAVLHSSLWRPNVPFCWCRTIKVVNCKNSILRYRLKGLKKTCLCALTWLPGILHGIADVGPTADGALHHNGAGQERRSMDPPGLAAAQVGVRLGLLVLARTVAVMPTQHLPFSDLSGNAIISFAAWIQKKTVRFQMLFCIKVPYHTKFAFPMFFNNNNT